jgi:class 3 adenylate cyclase
MDFYAVLDQVLALLRQRQRVTYRALKVQFQLDDEALEALRDELIEAQHLAADEVGKVLVWTGEAGSSPVPAQEPVRAPHAYTPPHLAEKILTSRNALAGERKQVTVLFADLKGSMELLADRDPEEARQLLDPVLEHMMAAVHRYAGTVNQVMGDGIMALFGAPIAHEDHSLLGAAYALYGRIAEALPLLEQAVEHAHTRQLIANQALWLANLGEAYLLAGCLNDACTRAGQALEFARGHKGRGHEAYALRLLGEVTAQRESPETEPAETHYRQALAVADELGMRPLQAHCHRGLGMLSQDGTARAGSRCPIRRHRASCRSGRTRFCAPRGHGWRCQGCIGTRSLLRTIRRCAVKILVT